MKKLFFVLVIIFLRYGTYAQESLMNGNFSLTCTPPNDNWLTCINTAQWGSYAAGECQDGLQGGEYMQFNTSCMANWFITNGTPSVGSSGGVNFAHLQTYSWHDEGGSPTPITVSAGPGSVGIAANYHFLENGCYTINLNLLNLTSTCNAGSTTFQVWAANGLTESSPSCTSAHPSTSGFQLIESVSPGVENITSLPPVNFSPTADFTQILIFVDEPNPCNLTIDACRSEAPFTFDILGRLEVNLESVVITPCQGSCTDDILSVNQSLQIAAGNVFEHSLIEAGSSVAGGGLTTTVSPVTSENTVFLANDILLEPNFKAVVDNQHFFEAVPTTVCQCILKSPITSTTFSISPGGQITLSDAVQGGVWSISGPTLGSSISDQGVFTAGQVGQVTVTYTVNGCTASQNINVTQYQGGGGGRQASTSNDTIYSVPQSISVFPNPAQTTITITYPCSADGQLQIGIKDVAGRTLYTETVNCSEGSTVQHSVDISAFAPGVYFVDLTINDQHVVRKIVKL